MITADPRRRITALEAIQHIIAEEAPAEDRALLHAFAPMALAALPDSLALHLDAPALAARMQQYFRFVARTVTPAFQLHRGLPGIHVTARNPEGAEAAAGGTADGGPHEVTIIETHTPDAPFIFESLKNYFQKQGLRVFSAIHPMFTVHRQWEQVVQIGGARDDGAVELYCQFRIERVEARERLRRIEHQVHAVLKSVFLAVEDFPEMVATARALGPRLRSRQDRDEEVNAARAFLDWLLSDNYVLLGMLQYRSGPDGGLHPDRDTALGAFTDPDLLPVVFPGLMEEQQSHIRPAERDDRIIDIDYCNNASAIHHLEPIDDLVVREWAPDGSLARATLLLGRLAKSAFTARAQDIPLLREKLVWLQEMSGAVPNSHAYRETRAIFNRFPKRELFYADANALKDTIERMVYLASDEEIVVTVRQGAGYHAVSIAFSDLHYSHKAEEDLTLALADAFGPISFHTWTDCGVIALLLFYFDAATLEHPIDAEKIRATARHVITTWEDRVAVALERVFGPLEGRRLFRRHVTEQSRSGMYREATPPEEVPADLRVFEQIEGRLEVGVAGETPESATLKLYAPRPMGLTETLRMLQNLGLTVRDEMSLPLVLPEGRRCVLSRLRVEASPAVIAALIEGQDRLCETLRAMYEERATDCPLNALVLLEGFTWREVDVLRTLRNHLMQIRPHYNADTVSAVLLRNSRVAGALLREFAGRFDPAEGGAREARIAQAEYDVQQTLQEVSGLFDDEILRAIDNLVRASLRTNFYQRPERPVVSIKVDSRRVEGMVSPRPMVEIYVHSRRLEGIHLRGGRVARGGIRWSDRHDDFRTEVLGLMKTQMVKNSIIVPLGSKGGFVLKGDLPPRPALDHYLLDRYREFISGLLDVTDNLVGGRVVHPPGVERHDDDDPYLVVAADKGTAHLSDTANQVSAQYGFWLGDAFASGGCNGYDHKKEAITARGVWECVKHHFRTLGVDVQTEPFTMAGIGDMAGDVFGNGALQSHATKLVAAFNHVHIFLDPDPDPEVSYGERARLFRVPRSTWRDYQPERISAGGGVFDRTAKAIPLSPEVRTLLGIDRESASGEEVIRHILTSQVDLLYNGGIGTYVKASTEEDAEVGDRANDRVRVRATDVRARVVAEGGNLGVTQQARLEYWMAGGLINTDAIDNSGGVDMSDHEVNIKILLDLLLRNGMITGRDERNRILREMTDEVSSLVLADNASQALALTLDGVRSARRYDEFLSLINEMVAAGVVSRADDAIPTRQTLLASPARTRGLPRPLLAVLLGHMKNWIFAQAMETSLSDGPEAQPLLEAYFPRPLRERFREQFASHPLRREIVATAAVNSVINHAGLSFIPRLRAATGRDVGEILAAYLEADRTSDATELRARVQRAGLAVDAEFATLIEIEDRLEEATRAILAGRPIDGRDSLKAVESRMLA